jgi:MoxR-like ATPase/uncharacterized protein (DUF58 family)
MLIGLLANGNRLIESLPGLAKTRAVAKNLIADLPRAQFTPDLLSSDVTGAKIYLQAEKGGQFQFQKGPIFANLVLADEINRAPAKVQSALLEAIGERHVTVAGKTYKMPDLFMVLATENLIEQEGTYPCPKAQLDRFLMHVVNAYPDEAIEGEIIKLNRAEDAQKPKSHAAAAVPRQAIFDARAEIDKVFFSDLAQKYMVDQIYATRFPDLYGEPLNERIQISASPRGSLARPLRQGTGVARSPRLRDARLHQQRHARLPVPSAHPELRGGVARRERGSGHRRDRLVGGGGEPDMAASETRMPGVYIDLDDLIALEYRGRMLSFLPRQPVHSLLSGRFASRMRGRGLNFEEIRDYRSGDDVRSIDWKVTARLQKPHVRVFNEERDRQALLVVDQRLSMFFGSRRAMKSVTAAEAAAIGAWRVLGVGDRVGAIVFNDRDLVEIKARRSRATVLQILNAVVTQNRALGVGRGIATAPVMLNTALEQAQRRTLHDAAVIVISDFDGADDRTRKMIGAMTRHNNVVALLVHDPLQSDLPASARMTVTDGELQIQLEVGRASVRKSIEQAMQERLRGVFAWTRELGVPVLPLSAAEETAPQLRHLLGGDTSALWPKRGQ